MWTENVPLALEVALGIKAGTVWINCHNLFDAAAGFGGYKQSGYGRDGGKEVCGKCFNCLSPMIDLKYHTEYLYSLLS